MTLDDTLLFMPPCCVDRRLPQAIMQAPGRTLVFYTHGDVLMENFFRAVAFMVDDPAVMVLSMSLLASENAVFLQQCFERNWITDLVLSTSSESEKLINLHLAEYRDHILYVNTDDATDQSSHMVLYTKKKALVLTGPMYNRFRASGLTAYNVTLYPNMGTFSDNLNWGHPVRNVLFPDVLRHRQKVLKGKLTVASPALKCFLHAEFPPYKDDE